MTKANKASELVEIYVPRGQANDEQTLLISVNGKNYFLPKGKKSAVKPEVAFEYQRSILAQESLDRRTETMIEAAQKKQVGN